VTIYVNPANTSAVTNGVTFDTGWTTISNALVDLAATNAVVMGGHTVLVAPGTYTERFRVATTNNGTAGARNTLKASGSVVLDADGGTAVTLWRLSYFNIDGFRVKGGGAQGAFLTSGAYVGGYTTISNCIFYNNNVGANMEAGHYSMDVANCIFAFNVHGIRGAWSTTVRNCVFVGNSLGINAQPSGDFGPYPTYVRNSAFFGNGASIIKYASNTTYNTEAEINSINANTVSNLVRNPGYCRLTNDLDFTALYTNSPILNAADNGGHMGPYTNPVQYPVSANTYYVAPPPAGDDGNDGSSGSPWATLQKAASTAIAGDTVNVAAGTYAEQVVFTNSGAYQHPLRFIAANGVIVSNAASVAYAFKLAYVGDVTLNGFTIAGAPTNAVCLDHAFSNTLSSFTIASCKSAGVTHDRSCGVTLKDCRITSCATYGADYYYSGGGRIINCTMISNTTAGCRFSSLESPCALLQNSSFLSSGTYGANLGGSFSVVDSCLFASNSQGYYSGTYQTLNRICNSIFRQNTTYGLHIYWGNAILENCTFYTNKTGIYLDGTYEGESLQAYVRNCIIANSTTYGAQEGNIGQTIILSNCCFYSNGTTNFRDATATSVWTNRNTAEEINAVANCTNNIVANPLFTAASSGDYRLRNGSPCIDAGTPTTTLASDYYGNPRRIGSAVDIGINEWRPPPCTVLFIR
jgi:hypothetical protein